MTYIKLKGQNITVKGYAPKSKTYKQTIIKVKKREYFIKWHTKQDFKRILNKLARSDSTHFKIEDLRVLQTRVHKYKTDLFIAEGFNP